ncbi:tRNA (guanosine(46)-N7)-methyltransferase TrmB [Aliarcobacter butzleri]|jgi:tRNA (guanine-N7-)-methyltransferase|uniref:tRNA (guanine-N(7)-)-methyltransferase n=1 Tax=Aliarcobacter butzleri TaxID=28197 RepID=A0AAW7PQ74_9BACT|nr:tRNA (guanosine(46)-N7)-methyltransferase TrmB [Aliarcobacter butzleri]MCT7553510.1 tRNA (guanosine(46)-N7)-methyltransferase TrmB [Aliarcobacter butzleri]MDN5041759.1 tRNA (guanosine(46)-N7)-methyltransferase TrmB [Aliarcobacter butzleri]MDN5063347.1 tRNA (guanosine(46)-N7)-methyltransferase TrmB [Aliarcobacter butzleri]MDN5065857.1 tRNA (guanosine(46)-N7)-methyltransferase TrmB [Aliarcobacter butzleri]MDN5081317.1 tRNA (guanosine(46)-N7)-methyltransferase TrmB [Aliarcobacter butzleri]
MPHIVFEKNELLKTPSIKDGVSFEFIAKSYNFTSTPRRDEYKIAVKDQDKDFLLSIKPKDDDLMIKSDKVTRLSPVSLIKKALNYYVELNHSKILFSNTNNLQVKKELKNEYLKDINYFVDDFKTDKEIQIEIGFGSGRHLLHQAKSNPNIQFIGLEIHYPSIEQLLKQLEIQNITNVLVVNYDARLFMEFIESNKVGRIFVHFPVPWDKKPHRRIYSNEFVNEALRVLKIGGTLELRTDSRKYFDFCTEVLTNLPKGRITIDINKDLAVSSKYEDRWKKQGKNIYDVVLEAWNEDENINLNYDFSFDFEANFNKIINSIPKKSMIEKNFFVHIEEIYTILEKDNSGLIKITMGNFDRPVTKYILIENKRISYYQGNPLPTSANIDAHKKLIEILSI